MQIKNKLIFDETDNTYYQILGTYDNSGVTIKEDGLYDKNDKAIPAQYWFNKVEAPSTNEEEQAETKENEELTFVLNHFNKEELSEVSNQILKTIKGSFKEITSSLLQTFPTDKYHINFTISKVLPLKETTSQISNFKKFLEADTSKSTTKTTTKEVDSSGVETTTTTTQPTQSLNNYLDTNEVEIQVVLNIIPKKES